MGTKYALDVESVSLKPEYWKTILKYRNKNLTVGPQVLENGDLLTPKKLWVSDIKDAPEFKDCWMFSKPHLKELSVFPPRILIQNSMHSSFSKEAVKNAITGYSKCTEDALIAAGKGTTIESAQKFITATNTPNGTVFERKGVVIIPYHSPAKDGTYASFKEAENTLGQPNFTVRTNSKGMKYARMATNIYNEVEPFKVLPRMPYLPFGTLTSETKYVANAMLLDDLSIEIALTPKVSESSREIRYKLCEALQKVQVTEKKPPIYIIEGEKKALALYTANEAALEQRLISEVLGKETTHSVEPIDVVGVSGVWQTLSGKTDLQPDLLKCVDFKDRDVVILYDTDMKHNHQIVNAISAFAEGLKNAGAKSVNMVYPNIPDKCIGSEDKCKGFDDLVETLVSTDTNDHRPHSAKLRDAYVSALAHVQENVVPIKSVGNSYKDIKAAFLPFNTHSAPSEDALTLIADNPKRPELYR